MAHPDRYRLIVARSPGKAARQLDHARRRLVELGAGATPAGQDDTIDARNAEIAGLTEALAHIDVVICDDCHETLNNPTSRRRKVGPKCWAKRRKAGLA